MSTQLPQLAKRLKTAGYSNTKTRAAVFHALAQHESLRMQDLVLALRGSVDRASVYRTVELFEKLGIVQRVQIGWKYRLELSDAFNPHHHHIHCTVCGSIVSLKEDEALERIIHGLAQNAGFALTAHQLELSGTCQQCQRNIHKK